MAELVSQVYSEALFDIAVEMDLIDGIQKEYDHFVQCLKDEPDFFELLKTPQISDDDKKKILEETFQNHFSEPFMNFLKIIVDKKRTGELLDIAGRYNHRVDVHRKRIKAIVESVVPLTDQQMKGLVEKLEKLSGQTVELNNVINKDLVGGIVVSMGDRMIDGSVKYKLESILESLNQIII